jgi:hypothetical protein
MGKLKLSKKQVDLIELIEKCDYLLVNDVDNSKYPKSMIEALVKKGCLFHYEGKLMSLLS